MKDQWGRVESQSWPSEKPVWTGVMFFLSVAVACAGMWLRYEAWTPLRQYWLLTYLSASLMPVLHGLISHYRLMLVLHRDGASYLPTEKEVRPGLTTVPDGSRMPLVLTVKPSARGGSYYYTVPAVQEPHLELTTSGVQSGRLVCAGAVGQPKFWR